MEEILLKIDELAKYHDQVSPELIKAKDIKLGLRNADGSGVVVGITSKGMVVGYEKNPAPHSGGHVVTPVEGRLLYCCLLYTSPSPRDS